MSECSWNIGASGKRSQLPNLEQFEKQNHNVVLGYNPKYKINIQGFLLK